MKEFTLELTDYCPYECTFCSSNAGPDKSQFLDIECAKEMIVDTDAQIIHLSGGEPLAHPQFWTILRLAQARVGGRNVRVMSNAIQWLAYNAAAISGVRIEANFTPEPGLDQINVLQRVEQGREREQPAVKFSRNHGDACPGDCGHRVVRPDGTVSSTPCRKDDTIELSKLADLRRRMEILGGRYGATKAKSDKHGRVIARMQAKRQSRRRHIRRLQAELAEAKVELTTLRERDK